MNKPIRVLLVEDSPDDALLIIRRLEKEGYDVRWEQVETAEAMRQRLTEQAWDVILCDYSLPLFSGPEALRLYRELVLDIPFIVVSGAIGEETAVEVMKSGAHDYIMKDRLQRLGPAIERELKEAGTRREHKIVQNSLIASEAKFRKFFESNPTIIGISTVSEGMYIDINPAFESILGWSREEAIGNTSRDLGIFVDFSQRQRIIELIRDHGQADDIEVHIRKKNGDILIGAFSGRAIELHGIPCLIAQVNDITAIKKAQEELAGQYAFLNTLLNTIPSPVFYKDAAGRYLGCNRSFESFLGLPREAIVGKTAFDIAPSDLAKTYEEADRELMSRLETQIYENRVRHASGKVMDVIFSKAVFFDPEGKVAGLIGIINDITDLKRAEQALRDREKQFRTLTENMPDIVARFDLEYRHLYINPAITLSTGMDPGRFIGKTNEELGMDEANVKLWHGKLRTVFETGKSVSFFYDYPSRHGLRNYYVTFVSEHDDHEEIVSVLSICQDITDFQKLINDLHQSEEKYRMIFENAREGIFRSTPKGKLLLANQSLAAIYGYASPEEMIASINDLTHQVYVDPDDRRNMRMVLEREGYLKDFEARQFKKDGTVLWVSMSIGVVRDDANNILYFEGILEDITERKLAYERLRKTLDATVQAIAALVEVRDPYTSGHQRRVADLARAMAQEMGLDDHQVEGLYTAGLIHDIGKISVPSEILSKPSKLTAIEYAMIKAHAEAGYNILKDVEFPWPIARMVLEHHERIDGSGYPQGKSGPETILESRVLAVADVVEAMASHRPYRPALGIPAALEEITANRNILYDMTVVDACLRLFRDRNYRIPD